MNGAGGVIQEAMWKRQNDGTVKPAYDDLAPVAPQG